MKTNGLVNFQKLNQKAVKPVKAPLDAGYDMFSTEAVTIQPSKLSTIPTGIALAIPPGWGFFLKDRSSMALKGLHVFAGVIDSGYCGEIKVMLFNSTDTAITITEGQKFVQGVFHPIGTFEMCEVDFLEETERGAKGFGSTGE